jgi:hypothetical protein
MEDFSCYKYSEFLVLRRCYFGPMALLPRASGVATLLTGLRYVEWLALLPLAAAVPAKLGQRC